MHSTQKSMANPIFLYYPNLIGYFRVLTAVLAMVYAESNPVMTAVCYVMSQGLDGI